MKKLAIGLLTFVLLNNDVFSFCGFYVAKADGMLKNKSSQVILVRDGDRTVITMNNDYKGDLKEFAMVVPVPTILKQKDIRVLDNGIFQRLNDYSSPRLVEYYDENPCSPRRVYEDRMMSGAPAAAKTDAEGMAEKKAKGQGVTVEARYTVGEYDILILSAKESGGLRNWLTESGYKIPAGANEALEPYIKSNLKFFVVKVNLAEQTRLGNSFLRPIQIKFESPKFMLPIRLGMANADGDQDMIVYAYTRKGRVECTNYRTVAIPTNRNIPLFVKPRFADFYGSLFNNQWAKEGKNVAFLEYAWNVSPSNYVKCDPCVSEPPNFNDMKEAGVWWMENNTYDDYVNEYDPQRRDVYFTRLHVRYNRSSFPQDLQFEVTPNTENFQARYVITHPATGNLTCAEGKKYLQSLRERRKKEMEMLGWLTGRDNDEWASAINDPMYKDANGDASYNAVATVLPSKNNTAGPGGWVAAILALTGLLTVVGIRKYQQRAS